MLVLLAASVLASESRIAAVSIDAPSSIAQPIAPSYPARVVDATTTVQYFEQRNDRDWLFGVVPNEMDGDERLLACGIAQIEVERSASPQRSDLIRLQRAPPIAHC